MYNLLLCEWRSTFFLVKCCRFSSYPRWIGPLCGLYHLQGKKAILMTLMAGRFIWAFFGADSLGETLCFALNSNFQHCWENAKEVILRCGWISPNTPCEQFSHTQWKFKIETLMHLICNEIQQITCSPLMVLGPLIICHVYT